MGPQDGVEIVVHAADHIVNTRGRRDVTFVLMGSGDTRDALIAEVDRLGLQDYVELPGRVPDEYVSAVLSTADLGLSPDPLNPLNDVSTMNKTMEYMAFGLPVVAFDLRETKYSAQEAAVYAQPNDVTAFAERILELLDDPGRRELMGQFGRERIEDELAWEHQAKTYVEVFDELVGGAPESGPDRPERPDVVVDLREPQPAAESTGPASTEA
jgi:glycosyltransferase involved in cell wall biosynthesis